MGWKCIAKRYIAIELAVAVLVLGAFASRPYRLVVVSGASMYPTYRDGSIQVEKLDRGDPHKGEVVVVNSPVGTLVKRIAYLPGDTIHQVKIGNAWTDMVELNFSRKSVRNLETRTYKIPSGEVYVLGDNRNQSLDSTTFGPVRISEISGTLTDQRLRVPTVNEALWRTAWHHQRGMRSGPRPSIRVRTARRTNRMST